MAIITISRGTMSGGKNLAELLCKRLNYRCISREVIVEASEKFGVPEHKLFAAIQKGPSLLQRLTYDRERYLVYIQSMLCEEVKDDNVIYHGHAGHMLLTGVPHVLKIRIVADIQFRVEAVMKQQGISEKDAEKYIEEVDKQRIKWSRFLYDVDWRSPELYDMVFNLKQIDLDFVCSMIEHALTLPQFKTTPESQQKMNNLLLASRVKVKLTEIPNVHLEQLQVENVDGTVILKGRTKSSEMSKIIEETVAKVMDVNKVVNKLQVNYRYQGIDP